MSGEAVDGALSVERLVIHVADAVGARGLSPESEGRLVDLMRRFSRFAEALGEADARVVGHRAVESFVLARSRAGEPPAIATMHLRRAAVRLLFAEGRSLKLVDHDPTLDLRLPPRSSSRSRPLSDEEIVVCRSYALTDGRYTRLAAAWALAEATGRSAELASVEVSDLDLDSARVWLHGGSKTEPRWGKLSAWGQLQLERRLRTLGARSPAARLICPRAEAGISATASASIAIATTLRRAGLLDEPDVRPTSVAAWAGARALNEGVPIHEIARMLGIRSLDRTAAFIGFAWALRRAGTADP